MSDPYAQRNLARDLEQTQVIERAPLYLPWSQRVLNPFPLASSGAAWGDMPQSWAVNLLMFYCTVYVITTNNATNFWTVALVDNVGTVLASFTTAAIANDVSTRFAAAISVQPSAANPRLAIVATATLAPGAIFIWPSVALLRTGN